MRHYHKLICLFLCALCAFGRAAKLFYPKQPAASAGRLPNLPNPGLVAFKGHQPLLPGHAKSPSRGPWQHSAERLNCGISLRACACKSCCTSKQQSSAP